ncbi:hypothetical protein C5167_029208 [Papaver somniferum]|nr:hypothetical protein C5167_029208 [Papaver somniferum]
MIENEYGPEEWEIRAPGDIVVAFQKIRYMKLLNNSKIFTWLTYFALIDALLRVKQHSFRKSLGTVVRGWHRDQLIGYRLLWTPSTGRILTSTSGLVADGSRLLPSGSAERYGLTAKKQM